LIAAGDLSMSKYNPLSARLAGHAGPEWRASFAEIEEVLGFPLPKGARTSKAWWKNAAAPHARAWIEGGWEAGEIDHAGGLVTFRKILAPVTTGAGKSQAPASSDEPQILKRLDVTPKWNIALVAGGLMIAAGLSVFAIRGWTRRR
jgi:hypothetical protein